MYLKLETVLWEKRQCRDGHFCAKHHSLHLRPAFWGQGKESRGCYSCFPTWETQRLRGGNVKNRMNTLRLCVSQSFLKFCQSHVSSSHILIWKSELQLSTFFYVITCKTNNLHHVLLMWNTSEAEGVTRTWFLASSDTCGPLRCTLIHVTQNNFCLPFHNQVQQTPTNKMLSPVVSTGWHWGACHRW